MKQLGISDVAFLNLEQHNTPQHIGGLGVYDPSTAPEGRVDSEQILQHMDERLARLPLFRTRVIEVPGRFDRPYWLRERQFDGEYHLRHIALPQPGDWQQLCTVVARLHSRPLDMSRPLWEAYLIEGLDGVPGLPRGCFAIYTKMHHALVDGEGGAAFLTAMHDAVANPARTGGVKAEPRVVDSCPSQAELFARASFDSVKNTARLVRSSTTLAKQIGQYAVDLARDRVALPEINSPRTIFNQPVGAHRVFDAVDFPLSQFREIKRETGVTLNDVVLGVIGGALHRYLMEKGEIYEGSLATAMPLNMRERRGDGDQNNNVGSVFASLHSHIQDPVQRLHAINLSTSEAKSLGNVSPLVDGLKVAGLLAPAVSKALAGLWSRNRLSRHMPVNVSTVVTNVKGPESPLYCAGARMVGYSGLGLLTPGVGIFHAVFSYCDKVTLSVLADKDSLTDPQRYRALLLDSFDQLYKAVLKPSRRLKTEEKKRLQAADNIHRTVRPKARANGNGKNSFEEIEQDGAVLAALEVKARALNAHNSTRDSL